jgi:hypothetical protein
MPRGRCLNIQKSRAKKAWPGQSILNLTPDLTTFPPLDRKYAPALPEEPVTTHTPEEGGTGGPKAEERRRKGPRWA